MTSIRLENVHVDIPIYGRGTNSLKQTFLRKATGGKLARNGGLVSVKALDNINLVLGDGDTLGLVGHNGAGKTTLLRVMAGVYPPTQGAIQTYGRISPIFDVSLGMSADATGFENIRICGMIWGLSRQQIEAGIEDIAEFSELGDFLNVPVRTYSAGMLMRLSFAIATLQQPDILLIDEVIGVGDSSFRQKARQRLLTIAKAAHIVVVSSHADDILRQLCKQVLWLKQGTNAMLGPTDEVLAAYRESMAVR